MLVNTGKIMRIKTGRVIFTCRARARSGGRSTSHFWKNKVLTKVGGLVGGCTVTHFFCDFTFLGLHKKILLMSKSKSGEMLLTAGRGDLSGQLLLVVSFDSSNFALCQNSKNRERC